MIKPSRLSIRGFGCKFQGSNTDVPFRVDSRRYGPTAMLIGQGALAYSLMDRCGIKTDRDRHDAAYEFLRKGTEKSGYVWYGDQVGGGPDNWADLGRTGATGIANFLSPYAEPVYRERALSHAAQYVNGLTASSTTFMD